MRIFFSLFLLAGLIGGSVANPAAPAANANAGALQPQAEEARVTVCQVILDQVKCYKVGESEFDKNIKPKNQGAGPKGFTSVRLQGLNSFIRKRPPPGNRSRKTGRFISKNRSQISGKFMRMDQSRKTGRFIGHGRDVANGRFIHDKTKDAKQAAPANGKAPARFQQVENPAAPANAPNAAVAAAVEQDDRATYICEANPNNPSAEITNCHWVARAAARRAGLKAAPFEDGKSNGFVGELATLNQAIRKKPPPGNRSRKSGRYISKNRSQISGKFMRMDQSRKTGRFIGHGRDVANGRFIHDKTKDAKQAAPAANGNAAAPNANKF